MRGKASGIILWGSLLAGITFLAGAGGPDRALAVDTDLSQFPRGFGSTPQLAESPKEAKVKQNLSYGNIPLYFVPNKGQVDEAARFYAHASRYTLWLTAEGLVFDRSVSKDKPEERTKPWEREEALRPATGPAEDLRGENRREVHRLVFMGANHEPKIEGEGGTGHTANYFIGSDPAKWRTNIASSRAAVYKELYPNIDLKVYGVERQVEYDWFVKPGGNPEAIDFAYQDVLGTEINAEGDLIIRTELGEFRHRKPVAYQETADGNRESVEANFRTIAPSRYGFAVGRYDHTRPLIIDPVVLIYSTYLGGSGEIYGYDDCCYGIAVDWSGCAYVTGPTLSSDFPTRHPFQANSTAYGDAFVTKLTAAGNDLIYSTYLGGISGDHGVGISIDSLGCAYVAGITGSKDFPTKNGFQQFHQGLADTFVTKLTAAGNGIVYSTFMGGEGDDRCRGIALDSFGCGYIVGMTNSKYFPTRMAFQSDFQGAWDAYVTKLTAEGNNLIYSTYLGGSDTEWPESIAVDSSGCAYVVGDTDSADLPTCNPLQPGRQGLGDAFVTKLSAGGNALVFSTYLGGSGGERGIGIAVDSSGCAYVTGLTSSADFPTRNPFQASSRGSLDAYVAKFSAAGNDFVYSTYLGGSDRDGGTAIAVDSLGCAYITGFTPSADFPLRSAFQADLKGLEDVFVTKLTEAGDDLIYSTFLGGSGNEISWGICVDSSSRVYVAGGTASRNFPTRNPFQAYLIGGEDAFVAKLDLGFRIRASVSGGHGTVSPATQTVASGDTATVNIHPDPGYHVGSLIDNGVSVAVANRYAINNVREDHTVVVMFDNAPPTVKITEPANGTEVFGVVNVKARATDDLRILKAVFYIDNRPIGEDAFAEPASIYTQAWDTRGYAFGTHKVKAAGFDEAGLSAEDEISVFVVNVALTLQGQRLTGPVRMLSMPYIRLTLGIRNLGQVAVAEYVIYRRTETGGYQVVKEISGTEVRGPIYVWDDKSIDKDQVYTYRVLALSGRGVVLGISNEVTL